MIIGQIVRTIGALAFVAGLTFGFPQEQTVPYPGLYPEAGGRPDPIKQLNSLARFCAGLDVDRKSGLHALTRTDEWGKFADEEDARWESFKKPSGKIRSWVRAEVTRHKTKTAAEFYPFGGPDILFATLMRPSARLYVLVGLEPVGSVPDPEAIPQAALAEYLSAFSVALDDILRLSFFRRADLLTDMKTSVIDGVLPVFLVLLARSDKEILTVERGRLNARGEFVDLRQEPGRKPRALRLTFRDRGHRDTRTLIYLTQDLSDPAVDSNRGFQTFIDGNLSRCFSYIKSASYLMHKATFSSIAGIILRVSDVILQDDSGMPYRTFDASVWDISLYGTYSRPIELFKDYFQPDLLEAMTAGAQPLGFRLGYGTKSNLLLAVRKGP